MPSDRPRRVTVGRGRWALSLPLVTWRDRAVFAFLIAYVILALIVWLAKKG